METEIKYTNDHILTLLEGYFRDHYRPLPWGVIMAKMGVVVGDSALTRVLWGVVTGYGGQRANGPRRDAPEWPEALRHYRAGWLWQTREDRHLESALGGEGQMRTPPVDAAYVAAVLARPVAEVEARWKKLHEDPCGRKGFFGA